MLRHPEAASPAGEIGRNVTSALPVALLLPVVAVLALGVSGMVANPRFSASTTFALMATAFLTIFVVFTRRNRPRAGVPAACHALAWTPLLAFGAAEVLDEAIVAANDGRCGNGVMGLLVVVLPLSGVVLLVAGTAVGALFARRDVDRAVRFVAFAATALALIAFAFALPRLGRPDPDTYVGSLEVVAELHEGGQAQIAGRPYRYVVVPAIGSPSHGSSDLREVTPEPKQCELLGLDEPRSFSTTGLFCPTLLVRVDQGHDLAIVEARYETRSAPSFAAFRASDGVTLAVPPRGVADRLAPPIGWVIGAGAGGLIAAAFLSAASRTRRRAAALAGTEGTHLGEGWVELGSGERLRVDAAAKLPPGSVVLGEARQEMPTYRVMGTTTFGSAWSGTLGELRAARTNLAASFDAVAIAAAVLGATPLLVARVMMGT